MTSVECRGSRKREDKNHGPYSFRQLYALCVSAEAQQLKKVPRIGLLFPGSQSAFAIWTEVFRQGQRELGIRDLNLRD